ncbi:hypothetical protein BV20DRAFT_489661 [Pilatotrama ljubarskyi]|nr:hypothetical protein BV20DRAFT_489661 [Pilatotrama ljubarskyi]
MGGGWWGLATYTAAADAVGPPRSLIRICPRQALRPQLRKSTIAGGPAPVPHHSILARSTSTKNACHSICRSTPV